MKLLHIGSLILVIIGALNWLLVGLFNLDLVDKLLGGIPTLAKIVYILVGLSGIYLLINIKKLAS